jgi:hypothetical protein
MGTKKYRLTLKVISPHWLRLPDGRSFAFSESAPSHEADLADEEVRDLLSSGYTVEELNDVSGALDSYFPEEEESDEPVTDDDQIEGE